MKVYEVPLTFAEHHIYTRPRYQVSIYRTIGSLVTFKLPHEKSLFFAYARKAQNSYIDTCSTISQLPRNFKPLAIFCDCTAWFVSDLVGIPNDGFVPASFKKRFASLPSLILCI